MKSRYGMRNRLVRRLRLHSNMTALFRSSQIIPDRGARAIQRKQAFAAEVASLPLAKAFLPAPRPAEAVQLAPSRPSSGPSELPDGWQQPTPGQAEPPTPASSAEVFQVPEVEPAALPAPAGTSRAADDDRGWQRLQNIIKKHREKNVRLEAAPPAQAHVAASPPQDEPASHDEPVSAEGGRASASPIPGSPAGNPAGVPSVRMKPETSASSTAQKDPAPSPGTGSERGAAPSGQEPSSPAVSPGPATPAPEDVPANTGRSPSLALPPSVQAEYATASEQHTAIQDADRSPEQPEHPPAPLPPRIEEPDDTGEPNLQDLPLEAVWAVQMTGDPPGGSAPYPAEPEDRNHGEGAVGGPAEGAEPGPVSPEEARHSDFVRGALGEVRTAQSTGSGVEFIPPRRPRPVSPPGAGKTTDDDMLDQPAGAPRGGLQRQDGPVSRQEATTPGVIQTEIGPLPEDLWNLVGEQPPSPGEEAPRERPVLRAVSEQAERPSLPPSPAGQPTVLQRQAAPAPSPESGSAPPAAGEGAGGEESLEDTDIEELARQVFSEIRYRLGLEWERLRRR